MSALIIAIILLICIGFSGWIVEKTTPSEQTRTLLSTLERENAQVKAAIDAQGKR